MVTYDLLRQLEGRGVRLAVEGGRLVARAPQGAVTPELAEQIRAHKEALMKVLQAGQGGQAASLPEPLARLVKAAVSPGLNFPAKLPGGVVGNLGDYVLAAAALYAAGCDPQGQLKDLWAARAAWAT